MCNDNRDHKEWLKEEKHSQTTFSDLIKGRNFG
jgi:hypothetical protein